MTRIIKAIVALAVIAFVALAVFSYVGDLAPEQVPVSLPVVLDVN
jgi:predicted small integral membrane protein